MHRGHGSRGRRRDDAVDPRGAHGDAGCVEAAGDRQGAADQFPGGIAAVVESAEVEDRGVEAGAGVGGVERAVHGGGDAGEFPAGAVVDEDRAAGVAEGEVGLVGSAGGVKRGGDQFAPVGGGEGGGEHVLAPAQLAVGGTPLPAAEGVGGVPDLGAANPTAPEHDEGLVDLGSAPVELGPRGKGAGDLVDAQIARGVVEHGDGGVADPVEHDRVADGAADVARGEEVVRADRRALETGPTADPLPAAAGEGAGGSGGVVGGIGGGVENDRLQRRHQQQSETPEEQSAQTTGPRGATRGGAVWGWGGLRHAEDAGGTGDKSQLLRPADRVDFKQPPGSAQGAPCNDS